MARQIGFGAVPGRVVHMGGDPGDTPAHGLEVFGVDRAAGLGGGDIRQLGA